MRLTRAIVLTLTAGIPITLSACAAVSRPCVAPLERLEPSGAIRPTAQWGLGTRAGSYVFVSGMRGIDPETNEIVIDLEDRVRQAYANMFLVAADAGAAPEDLIETVVFIRTDAPHPSTDFFQIRQIDNGIREEIYAGGPYPNRTILGVTELNGTDANGNVDVFEIKGTFYAPCAAP